MSASACKIIINSGYAGLASGIERVLLSEGAGENLGDKRRVELLDLVRQAELVALRGGVTKVGVLHVLAELWGAGVVDGSVWELYAKPGTDRP